LPFSGSLEVIQANILSGKTSCLSLVRSFLQNIEEHQSLNAFIEVYTEEALDRAKEIDKKFSAGNQGKLAGLVVGLKDLIAYEGHALNASSKMLEGYTSLYSATAVEKLLAEDAIAATITVRVVTPGHHKTAATQPDNRWLILRRACRRVDAKLRA
jgi:aspartyl-tRNA(Asn)/glutamyl-tRNA(Gln) amidotransferase subunit A